ncbi:MAG: potassium transporter TrkG [Tepidisphaeraceae bacterium]
MSVDRAFFASVNAVTLSGFQQTVALDEYRLPGQIAAFLLTIAGTLLALIAGGMAVARITGTGCHQRGIIIGAVALELFAIVVGAVALTRQWNGRGIFESIFQAVSAFGHSGLSIGALPGPTDWRTHVILLPLSILGALGVPVLITLAHGIRRRTPMHPYVRLCLILWAGGYLVGVIALVFLNGAPDWGSALTNASTQSVNSRTLGFPFSIGDSRAAHWVLMLLMAVGGVSGAAAGGVKLTTLARLFTGVRATLRGDAPGRVFGIAVMWVAAYFVLVLAAMISLLALESGQPADRLLFLVISAASNVGLSHNPVSTTGAGLFVLSGVMLLGRLLSLAILWWAVAVSRENGEIPIG